MSKNSTDKCICTTLVSATKSDTDSSPTKLVESVDSELKSEIPSLTEVIIIE